MRISTRNGCSEHELEWLCWWGQTAGPHSEPEVDARGNGPACAIMQFHIIHHDPCHCRRLCKSVARRRAVSTMSLEWSLCSGFAESSRCFFCFLVGVTVNHS